MLQADNDSIKLT